MYLHEELNGKHAKQGDCKEVDNLRPRHLFCQRKLFALPKKFCIPKERADTDHHFFICKYISITNGCHDFMYRINT